MKGSKNSYHHVGHCNIIYWYLTFHVVNKITSKWGQPSGCPSVPNQRTGFESVPPLLSFNILGLICAAKTFARYTTSSAALAWSADSSLEVNLVAARKVSVLLSTNLVNTSSYTTQKSACEGKLSMFGLARNSVSATGCWFHQCALLPLRFRNPSCSTTLHLHARCLDFACALFQR